MKLDNSKYWLKNDILAINENINLYWYTLQVYYNNELSVKDRIEQLIEKQKIEDIKYILCPYEEMISITEKRKDKNVLKKALFPGYVFICLDKPITKSLRLNLKSLPKLSQILEPNLNPKDLKKIVDNIRKNFELTIPKYKVQYETNEKIIVIDGAFENFKGVVQRFEPEEQKIIVNLNILGRETITELNVSQVSHLKE